jgi:hypothetical protein
MEFGLVCLSSEDADGASRTTVCGRSGEHRAPAVGAEDRREMRLAYEQLFRPQRPLACALNFDRRS